MCHCSSQRRKEAERGALWKAALSQSDILFPLCLEGPSAVFPSLSRNEDEEEGTNGTKRLCPPGINCEPPFVPLFLSFDVNYRLPPQMERRESKRKLKSKARGSIFAQDANIHPGHIIRTAELIIQKHHSCRKRQSSKKETRLLVRFPSSAVRQVNLLL